MNRIAHYFPVKPEPLRMAASLLGFPQDFGNGERDRNYFDIDEHLACAQVAKRSTPCGAPRKRYFDIACNDAERAARDGILTWMRATLAREAPQVLEGADADDAATSPLDALGRAVQEDFALLHRGQNGFGTMFAAHVSFPSGWRPELLEGADFRGIHTPVPGFPGKDKDPPEKRDIAARSMLSAMIDRGPYVRFVWTVSDDNVLDHHPLAGTRTPWTPQSGGHFRCERQITVPFSDLDASLFLIRTYVYAFADLSASELATLHAAMRAMPEEVAAYKGLLASMPEIFAAIERAQRAATP